MALAAWLLAVFGVVMIVTLSKIMEPIRRAFDWLTWRCFAPSVETYEKMLKSASDDLLAMAVNARRDGSMAARHAASAKLLRASALSLEAGAYDWAKVLRKAGKCLRGSSLLECAQCTGFWVGILAFVAHVPLPGTQGWPWYAAALASGGAASGFSWLMDLLTAKLAT